MLVIGCSGSRQYVKLSQFDQKSLGTDGDVPPSGKRVESGGIHPAQVGRLCQECERILQASRKASIRKDGQEQINADANEIFEEFRADPQAAVRP